MLPEVWPEGMIVKWYREPKLQISGVNNDIINLSSNTSRIDEGINHSIMMIELKICRYNCWGLPKSLDNLAFRPDLMSIFENSDIICLQET